MPKFKKIEKLLQHPKRLTSEDIADFAIYGDKGKTSGQHHFDICKLIDTYHNSFSPATDTNMVSFIEQLAISAIPENEIAAKAKELYRANLPK